MGRKGRLSREFRAVAVVVLVAVLCFEEQVAAEDVTYDDTAVITWEDSGGLPTFFGPSGVETEQYFGKYRHYQEYYRAHTGSGSALFD